MRAGDLPPLEGAELTEAISAALAELYGKFYGHDRTTATTYINDNVVVCILEDILSDGESEQIADGLELPPGNVKGRMRLGLEKLRLKMEVADV